MSTAEPVDLRDLIARQSRDAAARRAAHPDHDVLSVLGPLDVMPQALRGALDLRRAESGEWLGRRADSLSLHEYVVATAEGEPDVERMWRWAAERGLVPDVVITAADRHRVTRQVIALAEREEALAARRWSVQSIETAVAGRYVQTRAVRIDADGVLVGHLRADEPTEAALVKHEQSLAAMSPMNRMMGGTARGPRYPADRPITAASLRAESALAGLVQPHEQAPDWAVVIEEIRAHAAP